MIVTRDLTNSYGESIVVRDVSLQIPRGGVTSIIGANGAGKSTLVASASVRSWPWSYARIQTMCLWTSGSTTSTCGTRAA